MFPPYPFRSAAPNWYMRCRKPRGAAMRRRNFIGGALGSAAVWQLPALAQQQPGRVRLIGTLTGIADGSESKANYAAFRQELQRVGWIDGQNVRIDARFGEGDASRIRKHAAELAALSPEVILTTGGQATELMLQATRTIPIVFAFVPDPVGSGFVESLAEPGGNATGFVQFEYSLSAKWPELLKEIAPNVNRAAVIWDPTITAGIGQFAVIQSVAPSIGIDVRPISVHSDIELVIAGFARVPNGGLIVAASAAAATVTRRELIITLAARHKLPAIAPFKFFVTGGGLMSYGADLVEQFRRAAGYVDRILKGDKPADLPVQAPNKYELAINLKTAKAFGITVPPALLSPPTRWSNEAAQVHCVCRGRCSVAARRACAAERPHAAARRTDFYRGSRCGRAGSSGSSSAGFAGARLGRRP